MPHGKHSYTQKLSRDIDAAYEIYTSGDPDSEKTLYNAFRAQAHNIGSYTPELDVRILEREITHKALMGIASFNGRAKISTWFYKIAKNTVASAIKKHSKNRGQLISLTSVQDQDLRDEAPALMKAARQEYPAKERALHAELDSSKLARNLPKKQADVLWFLAEGYSLEQIAKKTGVPLGTVRSRYRLAKEKMADRTKKVKE
jgi:RNA polymerase sigma-70 factor, ECF subfamily